MKHHVVSCPQRPRWSASLGLPLAALLFAIGCPKPEDAGADGPAAVMNSADIIDEHGQATALVCPGALGCERANGPLRVGAAARSITPAIETWDDVNENGRRDGEESFEDLNGNGVWDPVWLAGFSAGRAATGVHDDNWARVVTWEQGDVSLAIVSLDLVGFFHPDVLAIRLAARDAGLDFDHILVTSTHQHEGPDTMGLWGANNSVTGYDADYVALVRARTVEALQAAQEGATEARLRVARSEAPALINDTRLPIVIDQSIHALHFIGVDDRPISTVVFWGNHPEALGARNTLLTSDFPHYTRERLEAHFPGSTAVYVSGLLGGLMTMIGLDICPGEDGEDACPQGTFERAQVIGEAVADKVIASLEGPDARTYSEGLDLAFRRQPFYVTTTNPKFSLAVVLGLLTRRVYDSESLAKFEGEALQGLEYNDVLSGTVQLDTEVNYLRLGPVDLLTAPGELYPELWLEKPDGTGYNERPEGADFPDAARELPLQSLLRPEAHRVMVNQGNDALGYIIPKAQFDMKRPYAYDPEGQYGEDNSLGEEAAPAIEANMLRMFELSAETGR